MKALSVQIENVLGIEYVEWPLGEEVTEILGDNGTGKSSACDAIIALLGGDTRNMLRSGADKGRVWMRLDDNTTIERTWGKNGGTTLTRRDQAGKLLSGAGEFIRQIASLRAVRPAEFLLSTDRERIDTLLRAVPIALPRDFTKWITDELNLPPDVLRQHAVLAIDKVLEIAEERRLKAGQDKRSKEHSRNELAETLHGLSEQETPVHWQQRVRELTARQDTERGRIAALRGQIHSEASEAITKAKQIFAEQERDIMAEARRKVEEVRKEMNRVLTAADQASRESLAEAEAEHTAAMADITPGLAEAREKVLTAERTQGQFSLLKKYGAEAVGAEQYWQHMNDLVDKVRATKARMIQRLPISGLEIDGGRLLRHGVPFDRLNTAQQIEIVLDVAELVSGKLPLIVADGMERLTKQNRKALIEAAARKGLQFIFATAVEGMPLTARALTPGEEYIMPDQLALLAGPDMGATRA